MKHTSFILKQCYLQSCIHKDHCLPCKRHNRKALEKNGCDLLNLGLHQDFIKATELNFKPAHTERVYKLNDRTMDIVFKKRSSKHIWKKARILAASVFTFFSLMLLKAFFYANAARLSFSIKGLERQYIDGSVQYYPKCLYKV